MSKQVVTIGYLKSFTNGILTIKTSSYDDSYCPTYSQITGGTIFDNWSQNGKDSVNGIYVEGYSVGDSRTSYASNQLVVRADLKLKYISLTSISATRAKNNLSCCGEATTVNSVATFTIYVKNETSSATSSTITDDTIAFSSTSNASYATVDGGNKDGHTVTFAKNSTNFSGSVAARSATITNSYTYSGVSKSATVSITQNANAYGVSGKTMTITPASWTSVSPTGGSQQFTCKISFVQYDECDSRATTDRTITSPTMSSNVSWATTGSSRTVTVAAQAKGADSRSGVITFKHTPSEAGVGELSATANVSQQDNHVTGTTYSVTNVSAANPDCTVSSETISYNGVTTLHYRDGSSSSSSTAKTITSNNFGKNASCSTRSVTVSATDSTYGAVNAGQKTQSANTVTSHTYSVSGAKCNPSSITYSQTSTTLNWTGIDTYVYKVSPAASTCPTGTTSACSTTVTCSTNTSTSSRTLTGSTTWNGKSVSATYTQGGVPVYTYTVNSNFNGATVSIGSLGSGTVSGGKFSLTSTTNATQTATISHSSIPSTSTTWTWQAPNPTTTSVTSAGTTAITISFGTASGTTGNNVTVNSVKNTTSYTWNPVSATASVAPNGSATINSASTTSSTAAGGSVSVATGSAYASVTTVTAGKTYRVTINQNNTDAQRTIVLKLTQSGKTANTKNITFTQAAGVVPEECTFTCSDFLGVTANTAIPATPTGDTLILSYEWNKKTYGGKVTGAAWVPNSHNIILGTTASSDWIVNTTTVGNVVHTDVSLPKRVLGTNTTTSQKSDNLTLTPYHCADRRYSPGEANPYSCSTRTVVIYQQAAAGTCTISSISCNPASAYLSDSVTSVTTTVSIQSTGNACAKTWRAVVRDSSVPGGTVTVIGNNGDTLTVKEEQTVTITSIDDSSKTCTFDVSTAHYDNRVVLSVSVGKNSMGNGMPYVQVQGLTGSTYGVSLEGDVIKGGSTYAFSIALGASLGTGDYQCGNFGTPVPSFETLSGGYITNLRFINTPASFDPNSQLLAGTIRDDFTPSGLDCQ